MYNNIIFQSITINCKTDKMILIKNMRVKMRL